MTYVASLLAFAVGYFIAEIRSRAVMMELETKASLARHAFTEQITRAGYIDGPVLRVVRMAPDDGVKN